MTFRDQDSRSRLEVQVRGETETRLSKLCLETVSRPETGLENSITTQNHENCLTGHGDIALAPEPRIFSMPKTFEITNTLYGTTIHFKSINSQYFTIFLDNF